MNTPYKRIRGYISSLPPELLVGSKTTFKEEYSDEVIPFELYRGISKYIERIPDQINKAYCYKIYDGCLVLMRRLLETLLILAFRKNNIEPEILNEDGNHLPLSKIINKAEYNSVLALTLNAKQSLKPFAVGGNLSAHNPYFYARKSDFSSHFRLQFRSLFEELLYKAGILQ